MKKLFTLVAAALMAAGANAQGSYIITEGQEIPTTAVTSVTGITLEFYGASVNPYSAGKKTTNWADADFGAYTPGNGVNGNKDNGTRYVFKPTVDGKVVAAIQANAAKALVLLEGETDIIADASKVSYNLPAAQDGESQTLDDDAHTVETKTNGTITFSVSAGKEYQLYMKGSKLGFYGFKFTTEDTGINAVEATNDKESATFNLAGQRVDKGAKGILIKGGKKYINK